MPEFDALVNAAVAAAKAGGFDESVATYQRALALSPSNAGLHHNIGVLLARRGDLASAFEHLVEAERLTPGSPVSSLALGHVCFGAGRIADAAAAFERALQRAPDSQEAADNLGLTLHALGESERALPILAQARLRRPFAEEIFRAQFEALNAMGKPDEADEAFLQFQVGASPSAWLAAMGLRWARLGTHAELEMKFQQMAVNWKYEVPDLPRLAAVISSMQYFDFSRDAIAQLYRSYNALMQLSSETAPARAATRAARTAVRLRVGYLSADFRRHVMGDLMLDVFACHDHELFEVFAYSLLPEALEDATTARFRDVSDGFASLAALDDHAAAQQIADDCVDVLVDLTSHTPQARPGILLHKPAPVIVAHLGDHGLIGLEQVDFKITDSVADLPDAAGFQIERPFAMQGCVMPFRRVAPAPVDSSGRAGLGVPADAFIFGAFADAWKLSPRVLSLWRRILDATPNAYLALSPFTKAKLIASVARLAAAGISENRIVVIQPSADEAVNRARYRHVDVLLDTLPYTGGDSTVAALDMGVPVVTRTGRRQAERMGHSILTHLGVSDTVAQSDEDYVAIACRLAIDPMWRSALSARILAGIESTGIADFSRYTRSLEEAYTRMIAITHAERR